MDDSSKSLLNCPVPIIPDDKILLSHGSGGLLSHKLIHELIIKNFSNPFLQEEHDGAVLNFGNSRIAFTTDSFVVQPLFFPGGSIAELAVNGTVNDITMCGAKPLFISAAFIIEEGFDRIQFERIVKAMKAAADFAGVQIVTGDTKVVEKGKGDKIFINTAGLGLVYEGVEIAHSKVQPGDKIILSGTIADHGIAVLAARENLSVSNEIKSDTAPLNHLADKIFSATKNISMMRDPTRGGLASTLNEIAIKTNFNIVIREGEIKIKEEVKSYCEILGFDPLYIANEGKMICFVRAEEAEKVLEICKSDPLGKDAAIIGEVTNERSGRVLLKTTAGTMRIVDMLTGEQLPRIC